MLKTSLLSVIKRCGLDIHRNGSNYKVNCPFHDDKTPSLIIYPNTNSWVCFGKCIPKKGRFNGGGPIQFVQQYFNYSYYEAIKWIEQNSSSFDITEVIEEEPKLTEPHYVPTLYVEYWHSLLGDNRSYFHSRRFNDTMIDTEKWGWTGDRYSIPVWEGQPGYSNCLGVRRRKTDGSEGEKYLGLKNYNQPTVWGRWYCREAETILGFAGELDAAMANQDNLPSFSVVNGINALSVFPPNWPELWFPKSKYLICVFDKKEQRFAGQLAMAWNKIKGTMTGKVFWWDLGSNKDYNEFRKERSVEDFLNLMLRQKLTYSLR